MFVFRVFDAQGETLGETSGETREEAVNVAADLDWETDDWFVSTRPHRGPSLN